MIKVINVKLADYCWESIDVDKDYIYYECPALNKFLNQGYTIKDFKTSENNCIFILEKQNKTNK